jgi:hypothetical protein
VAGLLLQLYEAVVATGAGDEDYIATVKLAERLAGL